jgi:hypothetical protein
MSITVREVQHEEKSVQEVENELLEKHQQQQEAPAPTPEPEVQPEPVAVQDPDESVVLSYIRNRYNKDINSVDEIFSQTQSNEDLPEDVSSFLKFKKDTGRGIEDFIKINRDFEKEDPMKVLSEYMAMNNPDLDAEDIAFEIESKYSFDEEFDDEREVKAKRIAMKKDLSEAVKFFNNQKDQYKIPLESRGSDRTGDEDYEAYKRNIKERSQAEEVATKQSEYFVNKTNELFNKDFKGFGFNVDGKEVIYKPGEVDKVRDFQMNVNNFISTHLDDKGYLRDAEKYHKALAVATNPDAFAKYFYDQGRADEVSNSTRAIKNIDMGGVRSAAESISKGGFKVTAVDDSFGSGLRIRSNKNR